MPGLVLPLRRAPIFSLLERSRSFDKLRSATRP